ncbi:MAG: hypothetical protein Q4D27_04770 [Coriobacteriia bacterium]|nr:hypothetical protein [Coriobacteriia bacterium]
MSSSIPANLDERAIRVRRVLAVAIAVAAALACVFAVAAFSAADEAASAVHQQAGGSEPPEWSADEEHDDPLVRHSPSVEVPDLASLLGKDVPGAVEAIGHGAAVRDDAQPAAGKAHAVTVALAGERSRDGAGAPTVTLELDDAGRVAGATYSAALRLYGFSNRLTFAQAIDEAHVVQGALGDAGVKVASGAVQAPANPDEYSTYNDDGHMLVREHAEFAGEGAAAGQKLRWTAALDYDYAEANETGNLVYTHRVLSVGVAPLL